MKLSKIIQTEKLHSITIHVLNPVSVLCIIFIKGRKKPINKTFKCLDVDVKIPEISNDTVKHLGIKRYYYLKNDDFYVNLYYY